MPCGDSCARFAGAQSSPHIRAVLGHGQKPRPDWYARTDALICAHTGHRSAVPQRRRYSAPYRDWNAMSICRPPK
jgi:hypothetical protein